MVLESDVKKGDVTSKEDHKHGDQQPDTIVDKADYACVPHDVVAAGFDVIHSSIALDQDIDDAEEEAARDICSVVLGHGGGGDEVGEDGDCLLFTSPSPRDS